MVLSNKKLKMKLRDLVAATEAGGGDELIQQVQSVREKLNSSSKKPKPSKPRKPRVRVQKSELTNPSEGNEETNQDSGRDNSDPTKAVRDQKGEEGEKKKKKIKKDQKRKREEEGAEHSAEIKEKKKKKKNKNKRQRKKDKQKKGAEDECDVSMNKNEPGIESVIEEHIKEKDISTVIMADAEQSEQNPKKVYVGGIPYYSTEDDIRSFFDSCGTITEVDCMLFPETGKFRGIAVLTFKTDAAAKRALALDGADMGGFYLKIQPYKASREQKADFAPELVEGYNRIYAGNLAWEITEDDLRKLFSDCKITSIRFGMDKDTEEFKGYAHVDFSDSESTKVALMLDQELVCGRPVRIRCAVPKKESVNKLSTKPVAKEGQEDKGGAGTGGSKKRRTCYVCGIPGHISSACPQKNESSGMKT